MVKLTPESMQAARLHFAHINQRCIDEVQSGKLRVNDPEKYIVWCQQSTADTLAGKNDHTFTFLQMAHYIQTGEMRALLP